MDLNRSKGYVQSLRIDLQDDTDITKSRQAVQNLEGLAPLVNPTYVTAHEEGDRRTGDTTIYFYYMRVLGFKQSLVFVAGLSSYVFSLTYQRKSSKVPLGLCIFCLICFSSLGSEVGSI